MNNDKDYRSVNMEFDGGDDLGQAAYADETEGMMEIVPSEKGPVPKKKKRKKKRYFLKLCILVLVCAAAYFLMHSQMFTVKKIVLEENPHMTVEQLKEITGYKKGINLFEIDRRKNEKKLEKDTYIEEAEISRELPDTVKVVLTLREQTAVIQSDKGYVLLDDEGIVIDILEQPPQYTILAGLTVESAEKGETVKVKETKKYNRYMELLDKTKKADMYFKTIVIKDKTVTAYATDALYCTGSIDNFVEGMENGNLQSIFYDLMQKGIKAGAVKVGDDQYYSFAR